VLINLARLSVLAEEATKDTLTAHPEHLGRHTGISGTLTLTSAGVTTLALSRKEVESARARVDGSGLDDNATVLDEFLDMCARVGIANLRLLGGVEPDLALADAGDGRGKPLLRAQVHHPEGLITSKEYIRDLAVTSATTTAHRLRS
jgi:hypothetical protein